MKQRKWKLSKLSPNKLALKIRNFKIAEKQHYFQEMILFSQAKEKCEVLYCKLKIIVPDKFSIKEYKRKTDYILLSPRKHISKEKDKSYSITDESGEKIPNIELVLVTRCNFKTKEVNLSADFFSLKGLPKNIAIRNIIYCKPSTKETLEIAI